MIAQWILSILCMLHIPVLVADVVGSDTAPSTQPFYLFPASPVIPNRIANYAWMQGGFGLQNASTSVLFDSVFPVSGIIDLNGGTLSLNRDFIMSNTSVIESLGDIAGNNHTLSLSQSVTWLPSDPATFSSIKLVLNHDITITSTITFAGTCVTNSLIDGNGFTITLGDPGALAISGILTIQNATLQGVSGNNVDLLDDTSVLRLDNVTWIQNGDYTFGQGSFTIDNVVTMQGPWTFIYESSQQSTINQDGTLLLDAGFAFSYAPNSLQTDLISCADHTSVLALQGGTLYASGAGLQLTNGTLQVLSNSTMSADTFITLGVGNSLQDMNGYVAPQVQLFFTSGTFNYDNVAPDAWIMGDSVSTLFMYPNTTLALYETMNLGSGIAEFGNDATLARVPTATLNGSIVALGTLNFVIL